MLMVALPTLWKQKRGPPCLTVQLGLPAGGILSLRSFTTHLSFCFFSLCCFNMASRLVYQGEARSAWCSASQSGDLGEKP